LNQFILDIDGLRKELEDSKAYLQFHKIVDNMKAKEFLNKSEILQRITLDSVFNNNRAYEEKKYNPISKTFVSTYKILGFAPCWYKYYEFVDPYPEKDDSHQPNFGLQIENLIQSSNIDFDKEIRRKADDILKEKINEKQLEIDRRTEEFKVELESVKLDDQTKFGKELRERMSEAEKQAQAQIESLKEKLFFSNFVNKSSLINLNSQLNDLTSRLSKYEN
jgi:hypothetical protein